MAAASSCYSSPLQFQQLPFAKTLSLSSKPISRKTQINPKHLLSELSIRKSLKKPRSLISIASPRKRMGIFTVRVLGFKEVIKKHDNRMPLFPPKPFLLYSKPHITRNVEAYKDAFKDLNSVIAYPVKANDNFTILQHIKNLGCGAVVSSSHEIRLAISADFDPTKCIYSGTQKCMEDLVLAAQEGLFVNINREVDVADIRSAARIAGKKVRVFLSIDPYIKPQVHPDWNTNSNFGISFQRLDTLLFSLDYNSHELELVGIQCHLGSNITKVEILENAEAGIMKFMHNIRLKGFDINYLNIGGGLGFDYYRTGTVPPTRDLVDTFWRVFISRNRINIIIEPGRSLIENTCCLINRVKRVVTNGPKKFIVIDGSVAELLRPSLYEAYHHIELVSPPPPDAVVSTFDVVGHEIYYKVCESADFLGKKRDLPTPAFGSWLVVHDVGAYGMSMSSTYNLKMLPPEYWVDEDGYVAKSDIRRPLKVITTIDEDGSMAKIRHKEALN